MKAFLAILVLNAAFSAHAAVNQYHVWGVPKEGTGCLESAILMGQKFERATGRKVDLALCERDHDQSYDLRVDYQGDKPVDLVSTEGRGSYAGTYFKLADCQAELAGHVAQFETRTKLKPFQAYCYIDQSGLQTSIGSRIDAFGSPLDRPFVYDSYLFSRLMNPAAVEADLTSALKNLGLEIAMVKAMPPPDSMGMSRLVMKYYGSEAASFALKKDEFLFETGEVCEARLAGVKSLLAAQGIAASSAFCTRNGMTRPASINFVARKEVPWYRSLTSSETFKTQGDCAANQSRIVDYFKTVLKQPVFGSVCVLARGFAVRRDYRVEVLQPCSKFGAPECQRPMFP